MVKGSGRGEIGEILAELARLERNGWPRQGAIKAAEFAVAARAAKGRGKGREMPSLAERTAFDIPTDRSGKGNPLSRWARGMVGGRGEVAVRVPESPQDTNYTCGPAALRAALGAFGIGEEEDTLAELAGTSETGGTSVLGLADAAIECGLDAEVIRGMSIRDLGETLAAGCVVLACIQAGPVENGYESSHWVVPCSLSEAGIECMDPNVEGARSMASAEEFLERWHCIDMGREISGLALVLSGDAPANSVPIEQPKTPF